MRHWRSSAREVTELSLVFSQLVGHSFAFQSYLGPLGFLSLWILDTSGTDQLSFILETMPYLFWHESLFGDY